MPRLLAVGLVLVTGVLAFSQSDEGLPGTPTRPEYGQPLSPNTGARRPIRPAIVPNLPVRNDARGDPLPVGAITRYGSARLRHGISPKGLGFSPDGKFLCSISSTDDGMRLWDPATGKVLYRYRRPVSLAAFARNGTILIINESRCSVWVPAADNIRELPDKTLAEAATAVEMLPDGRSFIAASGNTLRHIDIQTGKTLRELNYPAPGKQAAHRMAISPDGRWLAGHGGNTGVWLWDLHSGKRVRTSYFTNGNPDLAFSPDSTRLVIAADQLRIFPASSDEVVDGFSPPDGMYLRPRFSDDGKTLFALSRDGTLYKFDAGTGEIIESIELSDGGLKWPMAISPDGVRTAAVDANGAIRVWDWKTGKELEVGRLPTLEGPGFSKNGKTVCCLTNDAKVHEFDATTGKSLKVDELTADEDASLAWNPRTRRVVSVVANGQTEAEVRVFNVDGNNSIHKLQLAANFGDVRIAFATAEPSRAVLFGLGTACILDLAAGKVVRTIDTQTAQIRQSLFGNISPDGRLLATCSQPLSVWEVATGKKRFEFSSLPSACGAAFSPNGQYLAGMDHLGKIIVFDIRSGTIVRRIQAAAKDNPPMLVTFSPDSKRLAVGELHGCITLWDVESGQLLQMFDGHDGTVTGLAFSPDGGRLASTSQDGTVLVWKTASGLGKSELAAATGMDEAFRLLGANDAANAQRGMEYLYRHPAEAVKFCGERIKLPAATPPDTIAKLVANLDSEDYPVRQAAVKDLETIGGEVVPALRTVADKSQNPEARKLAGEVLDHLDRAVRTADDLRLLRAVELLENINTAESKALLARWAAGPPGHRTTREAAAAMARIKAK